MLRIFVIIFALGCYVLLLCSDVMTAIELSVQRKKDERMKYEDA
jgi:hypothetical protein